jgi:hypothetical protein
MNRHRYNSKRAKYGRGPDLGAMTNEDFAAHLQRIREERIAREERLAREKALAALATSQGNDAA